MSFIGYVAALTCALASGALALILPLVTTHLAEVQWRHFAFWPFCGAITMMLFAASRLEVFTLRPDEIFIAMFFTSALILGVIVEWGRKIIKARQIDDVSLLTALLLSSCASIWLTEWLGRHLTWGALGAWFAAGVILETICYRVFARPVPVMHYRLDPPDFGALQCHGDLWRRYPRV